MIQELALKRERKKKVFQVWSRRQSVSLAATPPEIHTITLSHSIIATLSLQMGSESLSTWAKKPSLYLYLYSRTVTLHLDCEAGKFIMDSDAWINMWRDLEKNCKTRL